MAGSKKTKKGRKVGRSAKECQAYRTRGTKEKNKLKRMQRVLKRNPTDRNAMSCRDRLTGARHAAAV
jgi:hypothetical protein